MRTRRDSSETTPLDDRVDEMRRTDHDAVNDTPRDLRMAGKLREGRNDADSDIRRRRGFDRMHDSPVLEQHRVGIGAADVNADPPHRHAPSKTERKSMS